MSACAVSIVPVVGALVEKTLHEESTRVAQHRDEQEHAHRDAGDRGPPLAEVDLHLIAWLRLEAHRRHVRDALLATRGCA